MRTKINVVRQNSECIRPPALSNLTFNSVTWGQGRARHSCAVSRIFSPRPSQASSWLATAGPWEKSGHCCLTRCYNQRPPALPKHSYFPLQTWGWNRGTSCQVAEKPATHFPRFCRISWSQCCFNISELTLSKLALFMSLKIINSNKVNSYFKKMSKGTCLIRLVKDQ
jgi:hypothetical protein